VFKPTKSSSEIELTTFKNYVAEILTNCKIDDYVPSYGSVVSFDKVGKFNIKELASERNMQM
jgi:hypothetical protein